MRFAVLLLLAGCEAALDQRLAIVTEPRILAITAEPAEAKPGAMVTFGALVASPNGTLAVPPHWAFCIAGKPPTEDNAVAPACLADGGDAIAPLATQLAITAMLPADGCEKFGPDVPSTGFRPRDPDPTGGYYQPIRADVGDVRAFGLSRITCKLPTAPADVAHDYLTNYAPNISPSLDVLQLEVAGTRMPEDAVPAGADVTLVAGWPVAAAETYLYYNQDTQRLDTRRESLRVSWFATAGSIEVDSSGVDEASTATSVSTTWHAPTTPGTVWMWLVIRDSRGGLATQTIELAVR